MSIDQALEQLLAEATHLETQTHDGCVVLTALTWQRALTPDELERLHAHLAQRYTVEPFAGIQDGTLIPAWPTATADETDYCWRCDAAAATTEVGCCKRCLADLQTR